MDDLKEILERADVCQHYSYKDRRLHLVSRNLEEPLTDEEKERICKHLALCGYPYEIVFDN